MMGADVVDEGSEILKERQKHPEQAESLKTTPIPRYLRLLIPKGPERVPRA